MFAALSYHTMTITIPFTVEGEPSECSIELRDLSDSVLISEIYKGVRQPGAHSIDFDMDSLNGSLDAGIYILHVTIAGRTATYPLQYMP